jgi:hypothetical protein
MVSQIINILSLHFSQNLHLIHSQNHTLILMFHLFTVYISVAKNKIVIFIKLTFFEVDSLKLFMKHIHSKH